MEVAVVEEEEEEEEGGGGGALEPGRPTNNASRQAECNPSPPLWPWCGLPQRTPSRPPFLHPQDAFKGIGSARKQLFKRIVVN